MWRLTGGATGAPDSMMKEAIMNLKKSIDLGMTSEFFACCIRRKQRASVGRI
jgi:hypothetical protein